MMRKSLQTMHRTFCVAAVVATAVQAAPAMAKRYETHGHRLASYDDGHSVSHDASGWSGPTDLANPSGRGGNTGLTMLPQPQSGLSGSAAHGCWDCSYAPKPVRQFLPGDMTFKFRPVGGTLNYHF